MKPADVARVRIWSNTGLNDIVILPYDLILGLVEEVVIPLTNQVVIPEDLETEPEGPQGCRLPVGRPWGKVTVPYSRLGKQHRRMARLIEVFLTGWIELMTHRNSSG